MLINDVIPNECKINWEDPRVCPDCSLRYTIPVYSSPESGSQFYLRPLGKEAYVACLQPASLSRGQSSFVERSTIQRCLNFVMDLPLTLLAFIHACMYCCLSNTVLFSKTYNSRGSFRKICQEGPKADT